MTEGKAITALLADHKMIRKILEGFYLDNPRLPEILKTLHRAVAGHAWFEDQIFLPAVAVAPELQKIFLGELAQEHKDLDALLLIVRQTAVEDPNFGNHALQLRTVLKTHFEKEEEALFPLCEKILDSEGQNRIVGEMQRRQTEIRNLVN